MKIFEGRVRSNLRCRDTLLKVVLLLTNFLSEGVEIYMFGKLSALAFSKISKSSL